MNNRHSAFCIRFSLALFAIAGIISCSKDKEEQSSASEKDGVQEITFELEASEMLKTTIKNGAVTWATSDKLSVFDDEPQYLRQFANQSGKKASAIFMGEARLTSQYKVLYPYNANTTCSGDVITQGTTLTYNQNLPNGGGFASGVPAAGKINITGNSTLTDLTALLKYTIPAGQTSITTVRLDADQKMTGKYRVNLSSTPVIVPYSTSYKYVQSKPRDPYYNPGTYYLAVFPGTYTGLRVTVNGEDVRTISGSKTFAAGKIYDLGEITYTGSGETREDLTVTFLPAETSTKASSGIPWVTPASATTVAYCTNTDAGFTTAEVTVNSDGKLQFTAPGLAKNTKQLWMVYPAQDNEGKNWASKTLTVPTAQTSNTTGDFVLDNYPFAIKVPVGQSDTLDFTYSLNGAAGDSREESNATIVKFDLSNSLYSATGYAEKFSGVTCGSYTTTFNGTTQYALTAAYMAMAKTASASYAFTLNRPYQAGYTYSKPTINTSSGNIMTVEPQCSSRIVCVRSGDNIQTRLDACKPQKAYSKVTNNDQMRIASGTFTPSSSIIIRSGINVAGGYTAKTVAPFTAQGDNTLTKIDGNSNKRCITTDSGGISVATTWSNLEVLNGSGSAFGSGICAETNVNLSNIYIYNCTSSQNGGGLYVGGSGGNTISGCTIENCSTTGESTVGGGVAIAAACTLTDCSITGCTSAYRGGGIYAAGVAATVSGGSITNCTAASYGGGIFSNGTTTFTDGIDISGCSGSIGGGVFLNGSGGKIQSCNIHGNSTTTGRGGGLYINTGTTATSCNIYGNTAAQHGGGVAGYNTGKLVSCIIYGNTAAGAGGGVYWSGNTTINANVIEGGTIGGTSLSAGQRNYATSHGGGVYIDASAIQAKISAATVKYNQSAATCGGIYAANGASATITGCTVDHNKGGGSAWGGGVYIYSGTLTSSTISNNDSGAAGGIYARNANLSGLTVTGNTASKTWNASNPTQSSGGGMYCNNCTITGSMDVNNNIANGRGGGAYLISGTTWSGSSSAKIYSNQAKASYTDTKYEDGGGGLWIESGVTVHGSSATSLMKIYSNTATGYGGGAVVDGTLYYAEVYSNNATRGGGLLLHATASRTITSGGCLTQEGKCYNSCIRSNASTDYGGGVYMRDASYMCLCLVIQNTSARTQYTGFGIYAASEATGISTCPHIINCSVYSNTKAGSITMTAPYAGIYIYNDNASGVGYLYNTASRYATDNKDIYTGSNCKSGNVYGCHYNTLTRGNSTTPAIAYNKTNSTAVGTLFASSASSSTAYLVKTQANYNSYFDSGSSTIGVSNYFPIAKDYYGTAISGTITTIGCEVKFKTP